MPLFKSHREPVHLQQRNSGCRRDSANGVRIVAVGIDKLSAVIKRSPRTRCGENWIRLLSAHVCDKPPQVVLKFAARIGKDLLVVVRELDDYPITRLQSVDKLLPASLGNE